MDSPSAVGGGDTFINPFTDIPSDSPLNPTSNNFNSQPWLSNLVGFQAKNGLKTNSKTGVCFRKLDVYGFGSPTDYQKNVGNVLLGVGSLFRWLAGTKKQRIQILKDFDGLVEAGQMLLVLGR